MGVHDAVPTFTVPEPRAVLRPRSDADPRAEHYRFLMGTHSRNPLTLGALVLILCALVAATWDGPRGLGLERDEEQPAVTEDDDRPQPEERRAAEDSREPQDDEDDEPWVPWVPPVDLLLLVPSALVLGAALLVLARLRVVRRRRRLSGQVGVRRVPVPEAEPPPDEPEGPGLPAALDEGARAIGEGSPRNAIVAAWVRLEQAIEGEHFPHRPEETPSELVERALAAYDLDREAIARLAALYREARFSSHPVTEGHRAEAAECLRRLLAALGARAR